MKYGESLFDILYLVFAIVLGFCILRRRRDDVSINMGTAVLILGFGDSFHLVPRVLNYFISADFSVWLGVGKLVTSLTMTLFYLILYRIWVMIYGEEENHGLSVAVNVLAAVRIVLCLLPQNRWLENEGSVVWGIIRNIPFVALGCIVVLLFHREREKIRALGYVWLLVTLSFLFYIPVAVAASLVPLLGMLMLPKTVCYMLLIWVFWKYSTN